jgi:hypothetical protein
MFDDMPTKLPHFFFLVADRKTVSRLSYLGSRQYRLPHVGSQKLSV